MTIEQIYHEFARGPLGYLDAIEAVVTHCAEAPNEAERIVDEWADELEAEEERKQWAIDNRQFGVGA